MKMVIKQLIRSTSGQDIAEYAMALAIIAVGVILASLAIGANVNAIWTTRLPIIANVANSV